MNAMCSSSNQHGRRRSANLLAKTDGSRSSGESTQDALRKPSKSKSLHDGTRSARPYLRRPSNSFHDVGDLQRPDRRCDAHPKIALGKGEACPRCALKVMRLAAKTLERRAAELELERKEKEAEARARRASRRREKKLARADKGEGRSSGRRSSSEEEEEEEGRQEEIQELLRWSTGFEYGSAQRTLAGPSQGHRSSPTQGGSRRHALQRQMSLGQVARPSQMDSASSHKDTLIKIARLQVGDGAWIKRSDDVWTYATLKARENGPDAKLVFMVNGRGSTKTFPLSHWAKFVRLVEEDATEAELEEEEREIDRMLSDDDASLNASFPPVREDGLYGTKDEHGRVLENSLKSFGSFPAPRDEELSLFTVGKYDESAPPAVKCMPQEGQGGHSHRVSFELPDEAGETSLTSVPSEPSSPSDYDGSAEVSNTSDEAKGNATCKAKKCMKRATSLPENKANEKDEKDALKRRMSRLRRKHRVSWSDDIDQIKEEIQFDMNGAIGKGTGAPPAAATDDQASKKKLGELNMGKTIPRRFGRAKHGESFHSALNAIHRRSSVMMPPTTSAAINLN